MRVTGGILRGRTIKVPKAVVRPTKEQVREALFSILGERVRDARVADLFAGSGALGLEAWSRGAESVAWVESDRRVFHILKENVEALCEDMASARTVCDDAIAFLKGASGKAYDLILADPPYDRDGRKGLLEKALRTLETSPILAADGILVWEQAAKENVLEQSGWKILRDKTYGDTRLLFYVKIEADA